MAEDLTVKDVMIKEVISVHPETSVLAAHQTISDNRLNGLPVVDEENHLVGIITDYDLLAKGSNIHLPTLQKFFNELPVYKKDYKHFKKEIYELSRLSVREVMNTDPATLSPDASLQDMVELFKTHHRINPVPVIDKNRKLVGVVSRYDVVKLFYVVKLTHE